jgi:hypothetical protein
MDFPAEEKFFARQRSFLVEGHTAVVGCQRSVVRKVKSPAQAREDWMEQPARRVQVSDQNGTRPEGAMNGIYCTEALTFDESCWEAHELSSVLSFKKACSAVFLI